MSYYCTASDMLRYFGSNEMAQRSCNELQPLVNGDLFEATVYSADRSAWTAEEQANADEGLTRLNQILVDASDFVNGYLRIVADTDELALTVPEAVRRCTADIARYQLYDDGYPDDVEKRYMGWLSWLDKVIRGDIVVSPSPSVSANSMVQWTLARS